jgi:hypothetical protein
MSSVTPTQARAYLDSLALPSRRDAGFEGVPPSTVFDQAKNQALVAGSDIVSIVKGVTPERREYLANSAVLAQLVANQKVKDPTKIYEWYDAYFDVLTNIGWAVQDRGFVTYTETRDNLEAHEAIIQIATVLLGPGTTALLLVKTTLDALKAMNKDSPWITIFSREAEKAHAARFQVMLADQTEHGQLLVSLMAFGLEASRAITQVLFFKFQSNDVTLKTCSGKVTISSDVLDAARDKVRDLVKNHAVNYLKELPQLG